MRIFVAIEIDDAVIQKIQDVRERLKAVGADVKWVEQKNTHMTLKFIGEVEPEMVPRVTAKLQDAARLVEPFKIDVRSAGTFPPRRPSVLWVGADDPDTGLQRLHQLVNSAMAGLNIEKEKHRFSAHITLGRVRSGRKVRELIDALKIDTDTEYGSSTVNSITLFESKLTPEGPVYTVLAEIPLGASSE